ncbi:hypothetical protein VUR80DRAFT_3102 [Thermomyces stellatus]
MPDSLNVIALVSGGKDSFFSLLHCHRHRHRVVALANLHARPSAAIEVFDQASAPREVRPAPEDADLNSFMYQTVGHGVIPLYATATGLPVYRRGITGSAVQSGRDYDGGAADGDETESMTELLRAVMARHPEANAVSAGAILSSYQRTRVESVAVRLGLVPLAYLWKFPSLPSPGDDAQLLRDMAAAGLDARIVKVASAGLDEEMLWMRISSDGGIARARKGLRFFGASEGAVLGEGGEFETVVVDGPRTLFRARIKVEEADRDVVREGGGCSWLRFKEARVEMKGNSDENEEGEGQVRLPALLDPKFASILEVVKEGSQEEEESAARGPLPQLHTVRWPSREGKLTPSGEETQWGCFADPHSLGTSIEDEARSVMDQLAAHIQGRPPTCITNTIVVLRHMADFPAVNRVYGNLFSFPNPPSRVTISCGDLLPDGHNIAVYATYNPNLAARDRNGLHVQSRSYWAPANIGLYSQAIDVPLVPPCRSPDSSTAHGPRCIAIAGQIPLVPSTMDLPSPSSLHLSVVLSLQHLWRIAAEMKVQLWTSAVTYFPRASDPDEMMHRAALARIVWKRAHARPSDEDEDEPQAGPDLWDRRFNPEYMTLGDEPSRSTQLPDWGVFEDEQPPGPEPPLFAVEVEELPRGAAVEWHAHTGLSGVGPGMVQVGISSGTTTIKNEGIRWRSHLLVVSCGRQTFIHNTVLIEGGDESGIVVGAEPLETIFGLIWKDAMGEAGVDRTDLDDTVPPKPYLVYGALMEGQYGKQPCEVPFIPCRSIWAPGAGRVRAVALFRFPV